jgi:glycosyltransferase involved in cell wall biosynthesis
MKKKILMLSDHALSTSGVGCQSRHLINGLIETGDWTVRQFGAAVKHDNYDIAVVNEDFIIKPVDGFGTREMLRQALAIEKPDILFIFTDPRFFYWLFEMEDEIHQVCPIVWWHVWDNYPYPAFNDNFYQATDLINCHSHLTYTMLKDKYPNKANFVPHTLPKNIYHEITDRNVKELKSKTIGFERKDHFVAFWMNRNARRKRPGDLLVGWQIFMDRLKERGKKDATLLLHTDPRDAEGPNLFTQAELLGIKDSVVFSTERVNFEQINLLHNISDCCVNVSYAEGFGLATLEAMQSGKPIIALKTGGLTRQVVDHRDGSENGVALDVDFTSLVGSQTVPYIYEDYGSAEKLADAFMKLYELDDEEKKKLSDKVKSYVDSEFNFEDMVNKWDETLQWTIDNWKENYERWVCEEVK